MVWLPHTRQIEARMSLSELTHTGTKLTLTCRWRPACHCRSWRGAPSGSACLTCRPSSAGSGERQSAGGGERQIVAERERPSSAGGGEHQLAAVGERPSQPIYALCVSVGQEACLIRPDQPIWRGPPIFHTPPRVSCLPHNQVCHICSPYRLNLKIIFHPEGIP